MNIIIPPWLGFLVSWPMEVMCCLITISGVWSWIFPDKNDHLANEWNVPGLTMSVALLCYAIYCSFFGLVFQLKYLWLNIPLICAIIVYIGYRIWLWAHNKVIR